MTQGLTFAVLGPVRAWRNGSAVGLGSPQQRTALAILLLARGRMVSTDELAAALWGLDVPRAARGTIRTYVHRLRRALEEEDGEPVVHSTTGGYALKVPQQTVDLGRFRAHVLAAEEARAAGDRETAATHLHKALAEWQGEPMSDLSSEFAEAERGRLCQRRLNVLEELAALELELGRTPDLVDALETAAAAEPLRERLHELLMLCLCRAGRQAEALTVYDTLRRLLSDQLGVDPAPALRELHQRILHGDPELLAPPPPPATPEPAAAALVPAQLPVDLPVFTGREAELDRLVDTVTPGAAEAPGVVVVHGMPGVGKTTFAVRAAHRLAPHFPDGQLYLDLRGFEDGDTEVDPEEALWFLLDSLGVPTQQLPSRLDTLTALYRSVLVDRACLILLDNAKDTRQVLPLLPGRSRSLVIITSRGNLAGLVMGAGALTVPLDLLSDAEARSFLARRLGEARVRAEPEAVERIVRTCARLPLALALVAARAAWHPTFSLTELATELADTQGGLDAFAGPDSSSDIRSILSWSYHALSPEAARMFRLLACFPGQVMEVRIGATLAALPTARAHALFRELAAAHLVDEVRPAAYRWHELLRAYAGELLSEMDDPAEVHEARMRGAQSGVHTAHRAARVLSVHPDAAPIGEPGPFIFPRSFTDHPTAIAWFADHHSVLITMIERAVATPGAESRACSLAWSMRHYLDWAGHWRDLEHVNRLALKAAKRIGDRTAEGYAHRGIARVDCHHYRFEQAHAHLREALSCFADDTLARAYTLRQSFGVHQLEGHFEQALAEAHTAIELFREAGCEIGEHAALMGVAGSQIRLGNVQEGLAIALDALAVLEEAGELYGMSVALDTIAGAYQRLERYEEAAEYRERHVAFNRELGHGSDLVTSLLHRNVTSGLISLAELRHLMGREDEAERVLREAMTRLSRELAESYLGISRYDEAKATLRATLANLDEFLGEPEHEDWYGRATKVLHKTVAIAEELGVGAYILDN